MLFVPLILPEVVASFYPKEKFSLLFVLVFCIYWREGRSPGLVNDFLKGQGTEAVIFIMYKIKEAFETIFNVHHEGAVQDTNIMFSLFIFSCFLHR